MEVVINKCYGGFGLSNDAILWLIKKQSPVIKAMSIQKYANQTWDEYTSSSFDKVIPFKNGFEQHVFLKGILFKDSQVYFDEAKHDDTLRSHPDVIAVVKELGKTANGKYGNLKIVTIPDGTDYTIEEYDGLEWVAEKHKTWE